MNRQIIVTIGREFGSAGHEIGEELARRLGIKFYDRAILDDMAKENHLDPEFVEKHDEKQRIPFLSRTVRGYSNSMEDVVFELQSKFIREKYDEGESFVLIGRCGEKIFEDVPCHVSMFIRGDKEEKIARVMDKYYLSHDEAWEKMRRHDKTRKLYHNSRCEGKWGDSRTYDLCVNSSPVGVDDTVNILVQYVFSRIAHMKDTEVSATE